jgi:hypothetical protein
MQIDRTAVGLVIIGLVLMTTPVIAPPGPVLEHDTSWSVRDTNVSDLRQHSYGVYHYGNLSDRGQEIYEAALRADSAYSVPKGDGAPEFQYLDSEGIEALEDEPLQRRAEMSVVIVRPNESSLPPADEYFEQQRYDAVRTQQRDPEVGSGAYLLQFAALFVGVSLLCLGGYLTFGRPG